jgi:hypothetical protein
VPERFDGERAGVLRDERDDAEDLVSDRVRTDERESAPGVEPLRGDRRLVDRERGRGRAVRRTRRARARKANGLSGAIALRTRRRAHEQIDPLTGGHVRKGRRRVELLVVLVFVFAGLRAHGGETTQRRLFGSGLVARGDRDEHRQKR